jgi:hypothetical protein
MFRPHADGAALPHACAFRAGAVVGGTTCAQLTILGRHIRLARHATTSPEKVTWLLPLAVVPLSQSVAIASKHLAPKMAHEVEKLFAEKIYAVTQDDREIVVHNTTTDQFRISV